MTLKHMKKWPTSLMMREMHIKTVIYIYIYFAYKPWKHENIGNGFGNQHPHTLGET